MKDFSGLQIDVRCIKCGRLPTTDVTLFEMQNHLYICNICRQQAEQSGKQIRWVKGSQLEMPVPGSIPVGSLNERVVTSNFPPNSLFGVLSLPLTASVEEIEAAIAQSMRRLLREEDTPERAQKIEQLHEWQEMAEYSEALEKYRDQFKPSRHTGQALSVGGCLVYNVEGFLSACEDSREGWADGERYLRMGQLQHWLIFQIEDRNLAAKIRYYQNLKTVSNFHAFNEALYCLVLERPFRLYSEEVWQPLNTLPSAATPEELARLCDIHWEPGEYHLYEGSLGYWLEESRGIQGLKVYYQTAVAGYANEGDDRGVGLELLLERAVPSLPKPNLVVTFDGREGQYMLDRWDREIPHQLVTVKITNTTRGFTSVDMALEQPASGTEPQWISLNNFAPVRLTGTPGQGMPASKTISLMNLSALGRGRKYKRALTISVAGAYGQPQAMQKFPITLKTMRFFRGLRGRLWQWGLRGGLVGFAWNFAAGGLLALLLSVLIPVLVPASYLYQTTYDVSFGTLMQNLIIGTVVLLQHPLGDIPTFWNSFPVLVGGITGLVGFGVGNFKGHTDYSEQRSASAFRKWTFWFSVAFTIVLLIVDQGGSAIGQALQYGQSYGGGYYVLNAFLLGGGSIMIGILTFIIACIVASIRYRVERYLRKRYKDLLNPPGRA
jgi:hypothetical protein